MHQVTGGDIMSVMSVEVAKVVDPFLADADAAWGDRYAAVLYGSAARGDYQAGRSNINLVVLADDLSPATLQALGKAFTRWRKAAAEPPLLMTRAEWARATDAFPIELADMRAAYTVLRGADPLAELQVQPADLRRALEREFRGKLVRLRQGYAALTPDAVALGAVAGGTASSVLVLFRALLALRGRPVPDDPVELARMAAVEVGGDSETLAEVVRHRRDRKWRCPPATFERYLDLIERATHLLDQLHEGDD